MLMSKNRVRRLALVAGFAACVAANDIGTARALDLYGYENDPRITVLEPAEGATVAPGQDVRIRVELDAALLPADVIVFYSGVLTGPPYEGYIHVPTDVTGELEIAVSVRNSQSELVADRFFALNVIPTDPPERIDVNPESVTFNFPATDLDRRANRLSVAGTYAGGVVRSIDGSRFGTVYTSLTPEIVTVDGTGILTPVAPGYGYVETRNGDAKAITEVTVRTAPRVYPPALDKTDSAQFTYSGIRQDPVTKRFTQQVSVKYVGELPCPMPIQLGLRDVPEGIEFIGGNIGRREPASGVPLIWVQAETGGRTYLLPGETGTATLEFRNRHGRPMTYSPSLYCGHVP